MEAGSHHTIEARDRIAKSQRERYEREKLEKAAEGRLFNAVRALAFHPDDAATQAELNEAYHEYEALYNSDLGNAVAKVLRRPNTNLLPALTQAMVDARKADEAEDAAAIAAVAKVVREHSQGPAASALSAHILRSKEGN
jgi:hypothetical protein